MSSNSAWDRQDDTGSYNYFSQGASDVSLYRRPLLYKPQAAATKPQWQQGLQYSNQYSNQYSDQYSDQYSNLWDRRKWERSSEYSKRAWGGGAEVGAGLGVGVGAGVGARIGAGAGGARRGVPGTRRRVASRASSNQMDTWRFSCKECGMKFNGPVPHKMHLQSPGHQRKVALLSDYSEEPAPIDGGGDVAEIPVPNNSSSNNVNNEVGSSGSGVAVGLRPNPAAATQKGQPPFICEVCNTTMNCEAALLSHKKGKRHLRAVKNLETFGSANLVHAATHRDPSSVQPRGEASKRSAPSEEEEGSTGDLSCESCGVVRFKSADFKMAHFMNDARHTNQTDGTGEAANTAGAHGDNGWEQPLAKMAKVDETSEWYGQ